MALRFLLVSLVAGMGFELPSQADVTSWTKSGRDWVDARMADIVSLKIEAERALTAAADCEKEAESVPSTVEVAPTRDDLAFEAVVEKMASDFAADLAAVEAAKPVEEAVVVVEAAKPVEEAVVVVEAAKPAEEAVVVVERFQEMPPAVWTDPEPAVPAFEDVAEARAEVPAPSQETTASRSEKISAAVRLTKQALGAWASLIQPPVRMAAEGPEVSR